MKKLLIFLAIGLCSSCDLDVVPEMEISGDAVINTSAKAESVLAQAYHSLRFSPGDFTLLTEDMQPSYLITFDQDAYMYYNWNDRVISVRSANLWESYYQTLAQLNVLLASENNIADKGAKWDYIKGQALVLKAYIYFELLQLFSDRYDPQASGILPKENIEVETNKRLTQAESIQRIEQLMEEGLPLIESYTSQKHYYILASGAQILNTRIALYKKEYDRVEASSKTLLGKLKVLPNSASDLQKMWDSNLDTETDHTFWVFDFRSNPNDYLLYTSPMLGDYLYINDKFTFEEEDIRYGVSQYFFEMRSLTGTNTERRLLGKYKSHHNDLDERNIVLFRTAEVHFNLIESLVEQNKLKEATTAMNVFLTSVNAPLLPDEQTQASIRDIFREEKQKEFIGEKINFFDLKRWNINVVRKTPDYDRTALIINATDYRWTWPIPLSELRYNEEVEQNRNWTSLQ